MIQNGQPIAYASRAPTETESRYTQIEEMLVTVDYTLCRKTIVHTDHKPLESILKKPLYRTPKRLQGMILRMQKYNVEVRYQSGKTMLLADTLSRAYVSDIPGQREPQFETINMLKYLLKSEEKLLRIQRKTGNE